MFKLIICGRAGRSLDCLLVRDLLFVEICGESLWDASRRSFVVSESSLGLPDAADVDLCGLPKYSWLVFPPVCVLPLIFIFVFRAGELLPTPSSSLTDLDPAKEVLAGNLSMISF